MYLYFNSKGVLEEVVNDIPTRKDSSNVNHIYVYIDGVAYDTDKKLYPLPSTITALSTKYQLPDGTITPTALVSAKVKSTIPYDKHRDMKCFKDFYTYEFFDIELPSGVNEDGSQSEIPNVLGQSGLVALTIIEQPVGLALGLVVFNVEKEVGITTDTLITEAQFNYLMGYIADYKKKIDESVQANINKVDGLSKVTPANNLALYQLTNLMSTYNGAYARRIKDNIIFANNNVYKFTDTALNLVQDNVITDSDAIEIANIQPNYFDNFVVLTYRVKLANGNYEIRARISYILDAGNLYRIGDYKTIDTNSSYGLYEPFTLILSNTTAYVIYSRENNLSNQDIVARKITFDTTNNTITAVGEDIIMVSGTNQKDDEGEVIDNSRPGFAIVDKLIDGSYLMVFESNINNDRTDYPYVVQYMYFKDIENSKTYTTPQTLFKVKFANVNIPYLAVKNDGRVVMTYHSTGNYYGANGDNLGIHKKVFEAGESNRVITYRSELTRNDFVNIPLYDNKENQWSGAWGSTFIYNDKPYFMYVIGTNTGTSSTQNNFVVANIEAIPEKSVNATPNTIMLRDSNGTSYVQTPSNPASTNIVNIAYLYKYTSDYVTGISSVEVTNNSLVKRSSSGLIYGATPTDTNPSNEPKAVVNKEYIGNVVEPIEEKINNKVSKLTTTEKAGSIVYGRSSVGTEEGVNYRSSAQYGSDLIYRDANGRAEIKDPVNDLDIANKEYVDTTINQKLASTYVYKGSVQTYADLPTDANIGDVYNVIEAYQGYPAGTNFAWTGTQWDALGGSVDLSNYPTKQEVATDLSKKLDKVTTTATSNRIYAIAPNGLQYTPKLTNSVVSGEVTVPIRDTNGNFKVGNATTKNEALNQNVADNLYEAKGKQYQEITWSALKTLRDNSQLIKGATYRITDFVTTTSQLNTQSANHPFDILVVADDVNVLNENAHVIKHSGDTYFEKCNLSSWKIKYCLDNDANRFTWANTEEVSKIYTDDDLWFKSSGTIEIDGATYYLWYNADFDSGEEGATKGYLATESQTPLNNSLVDVINIETKKIITKSYSTIIYSLSSGKGVIYYMKDEFNNECPYDFKNIQFKRYRIAHVYQTEPFDDWFCHEFTSFNQYLQPTDESFTSYIDVDSATFCWCFTFNDFEDADASQPIDITLNTTINIEDANGYGLENIAHDNVIKTLNVQQSIDEENLHMAQSLNNIVFTNYDDESTGGVVNPTFVTYYSVYGNTFKENCHDITMSKQCYGNELDIGNYNYIFGKRCFNNKIGMSSDNNVFFIDCYNNIFGTNVYDNLFYTFADNIIGNNFINSQMCGEYSAGNVFGNDINNIVIQKEVRIIQCILGNYIDSIFVESTETYHEIGKIAYCNIESNVSHITLKRSSNISQTIIQNVTIHSGVQNKDISLEHNTQYSTDVYATGSKTINV